MSMFLVNGIFVLNLILVAPIFSMDHSRNLSKTAFEACDGNVTLNAGMSYCLVTQEEIDCYVTKALELVKNKTISFPLWVQACIFSGPKEFVDHKQDYNCCIQIKNGLVNCNAREHAMEKNELRDFKKTCLFGFFYLNKLAFENGFYAGVLHDDGECASYYNNLLVSADVVFVAERYLSSQEIAFSDKNEWRIVYPRATEWTSTRIIMIALVVGGLVIVILVVTFLLKRKWRSYKKSIRLDDDQIFQQIKSILEAKNDFYMDTSSCKEIPIPICYSSDIG